MKKALAILVAVMLMATVCMTASAASCTMAFDAVEVEEGTATVDVPLNITANDGIWGFIVEASFDPALLEFTAATAGGDFNLLANTDKAAEGTIKLVFDAKDMSDVKSTGAVATLSFNVKGAAGDVAAITANLPDAESNINADGDNVDLTVADGSVTIVEKAEEPTEPSKDEPSETKASETKATEASATEASATDAPATEPTDAPATGSAIPAAAIVLAAASAAVLGFARKK